jgi:diguanylate cyclase (GGDEF)-like protein
MAPIHFKGTSRAWAVRFAFLGNTVPVGIATVARLSSHHPLFFAGAAASCVAPIIVTAASRRHRLPFYLAAFGGLPALTAMQSYSGGVASGYSVLLMMAMLWFGLQATDRELVAGLIVLALCCYLPMLVIGPPAYPISWGHATLLTLIGCTVAGSLWRLARETQTLTRRLREEAVIDDLTELFNRRGWRSAAPRELARADRTGAPVAAVMLDLDNFKQLNDEEGHDRGDRVLQEMAEALRATLRAGDVVARLGGDEFVALLSNCTLEGGLSAILRLRSALRTRVWFSAGVAQWDGREELHELLRRTDLALYAAKANGAGRTEIAPAPLTGADALEQLPANGREAADAATPA